jgi:hypothetical protein
MDTNHGSGPGLFQQQNDQGKGQSEFQESPVSLLLGLL